MYFLTACCIVKNEHLYLEEWVNYHRTVGIEHFYIYDNGGEVTVKQTLDKYISAGLVTVIDFLGKGKQMPAYNHCLNTFGNLSTWMAFIDCDEFIVPKIFDNVPDILDKYKIFGGLSVSWIIFGSSGFTTKPEGLVIENFNMSSDLTWYENTHTKAIVQPRHTSSAGSNPHCFNFKPDYFSVSENSIMVPNAWSPNSNKIIQLNHYFLKSFDEFKIKISRGRADVADPNVPGRHIDDFGRFDQYCNIEDKSIHRFINKTKSLYL